MKIKLILLLCCMLGSAAQAQTLAQAKELYQQEQYAQAKPVFKKYTKTQPGNGNYHLWYGVCCLKTGETKLAIKHLELAVKKRIPNGQLYLGQAYHQNYQFEDAISTYEDYIADLAKRKRATETAETLLAQSRLGLRLLKGVEEVCFIDSIVVDKEDFLKAYRISPECGKLFTYPEYFKSDMTPAGTVYETQLRNKLYYAELQPDSTLSILSRNKMQDQWSQGHLLPGAINQAINANYPYMMSDGITIYYAADGPQSLGGYDIFVTRYNTSQDTYLTPQNAGMPFNSPANDYMYIYYAADGPQSLGGYDIFVTRYNTSQDTYLTPQNAGMPFNSPANDYMYVIDEYNNLGWFASDRNQPEGKVCIYTFIPNASKQVYDYENKDKESLRSLAMLQAIKDTWQDEASVTAALERLQNADQDQPTRTQKHDFEFILDDQHTYYQLSDFRSKEALDAFNTYRQLEKSYLERQNHLQEMRTAYSKAGQTRQQELTPGILDLEKRLDQLDEELHRLTLEIRRLEKTSHPK